MPPIDHETTGKGGMDAPLWRRCWNPDYVTAEVENEANYFVGIIFHRFACGLASRGAGENLVGRVAAGSDHRLGVSQGCCRRWNAVASIHCHNAPAFGWLYDWDRGCLAARLAERSVHALQGHTRCACAWFTNAAERLLGTVGNPLVRANRGGDAFRRHHGYTLVSHHRN